MTSPLLNGLANVLENGLADSPANGLAGGNGVLEIMPLGDSITRGVDAVTARNLQTGYRDNLGSLLNSANIDFDFVGSLSTGTGFDNNHEGHSGRTIRFLSRNINRWLRRNPAEVVLLQVGTNDMGFLPNQSPLNAVGQLSDLIDKIANRVPNAKILVSSLTPVNPANFANAFFGKNALPDFQSRIEAFNSYLPGLVAAKASEGKSVSFVDVNSALNPIGDISIDGLHPNDDGYARIASTYFSAIQEIVNESANSASGSVGGGIGDDTIDSFNADNVLTGGGDILQGTSIESSRSSQISRLFDGDDGSFGMPLVSEPANEAGYGVGDSAKLPAFEKGGTEIFNSNDGLFPRVGKYSAQAFGTDIS